VVDVEVLGLEDLELEGPVLHLVPAEVLRVRHRRRQHNQERGEPQHTPRSITH
jgi:hypothetical protein